jgi:hypothetical protein
LTFGFLVCAEKYAGLSPGQLKLLTIGTELAANPSILFLDEPSEFIAKPCRRFGPFPLPMSASSDRVVSLLLCVLFFVFQLPVWIPVPPWW